MNSNVNVEKPDKVYEFHEGNIPVSGGKIRYKIAGRNQKGVPILALHGGPGASYDYLEPLAEFADERPVVFYDQLGCGDSDRPDDISLWIIERFVDEIQRVREALGLDKVHIIGQSWGVSMAVDYLLERRPEGVVSLVFSGPLLSASRWIEDQKAYLAELPQEIQKIILESEDTGDFSSSQYQDAIMTYYKTHVCRLDPWPECLSRTLEKLNSSIYAYMWGPSEFTVNGTLKNYERVDRLKKIVNPVLFTCGFYDEATPATTAYYQKNLPGSELYVFEDASHEHHLEKPEEYQQVVRRFLRSAEKAQESQAMG